MHPCPLCGKTMATSGGLEVHMELSHRPEVPKPEPEPEPVLEPLPPPVRERPTRTHDWRLSVGRFDSTFPLTALMVVALLVGGIGAAVHRGTGRETVAAVSGLSATGSPATTVPPATASPAPSGSDASSTGTAPSTGVPSPTSPQSAASVPGTAGTPPCQQVIGMLATPASRRTVDLADLMRAGTFPALPLSGFEHPVVLGLTRYDTAQQYLQGTPVIDQGLWQTKLAADGFRTAEAIGFQVGQDFYGAEALRFGSPLQASDFNRATLAAVCATGAMERARVLPNLTGGLMYILVKPGSPPFRASFVAGDTVVHLNICECVEAPDQEALAGQWAQAVAAQVGAA